MQSLFDDLGLLYGFHFLQCTADHCWTMGENDSLHQKLYQAYLPITFTNKNVSKLKLPKRKYDSPLYVNDLIPFRSGYIINSISSSWGRELDVRYNFYYIDLVKNDLSKIHLEELDTIHSMIVDKGILYASGKKAKQFKVFKYSDTKGEELIFDQSIQNIIQQDYNWIKLGIYKNELIALLNNGIIQYKNNKWEYLENYSLEAYLKEMGRRNTRWLFPTENIRVHDDKIYLMWEITQGRTSTLMKMDLQKPNDVESFLYKFGLVDNTKKEVDSYLINNDGSLYVTITRLMANSIVLHVTEDSVSTIILNGQLKEGANQNTLIDAHCIVEDNGNKIIFGCAGIFSWKENDINPLAFLENTEQAVKIEIGTLHWRFQPRTVAILEQGKYLVGGLWGGLYIMDMNSKSISCLDDVKARPGNKKLFE